MNHSFICSHKLCRVIQMKSYRHTALNRRVYQLSLCFLFGAFLGCQCVLQSLALHPIHAEWLESERSFPLLLWKNVLCFVPMVLCCGRPLGTLLAPLTLFLRGFFLCCTASVLMFVHTELQPWAWGLWLLPALIQLLGLLVLGSKVLELSVTAVRSRKRGFFLNHLKKECLFALTCSFVSALLHYFLLSPIITNR